MAIKQFSLGSILQYRKSQEDLARQQLAQAQIEEEKVNKNLQALRLEVTSLVQTLEIKQETGILTFELARYEERINYLHQQITFTKNELERKKDCEAKEGPFTKKK